MNDGVIRIGVLGAARITPRAIFEPARTRTDVEVRAVAARDPNRARRVADEFGIPHVENDYAGVLARDDIDVVYIPLPPSLHAEWTVRALKSGKAVLCEKPFAVSVAEAESMVRVAAEAGMPLIEAFHYRYHPIMRRVVDLVGRQALGRILSAEAVFDAAVPYPDILWEASLGCGALTDVGCYPIHALRTLLGEPKVSSANAQFLHGTHCAVDARLDFPGGVGAHIRSSLADDMPPGTRLCNLRLEGERGSMFVSNFVAPHIYGSEFWTKIDGIRREEPVDGPSTYQAQLDQMVDVVRGQAIPLTGGEDAIANMRTIDDIRRAASENRAPSQDADVSHKPLRQL